MADTKQLKRQRQQGEPGKGQQKIETPEEQVSREKRERLVSMHISRFHALETRKSKWDDLHEEVAEYVLPMREDIEQTEEEGEKHGTKMYDGSGVTALNISANGMFGNILNPSLLWFSLSHPSREVRELPEVRRWLQDTAHDIYMALHRTNFYREMLPFIKDGIALGTSCIYIENNVAENRIVFTTIHPAQIFISENGYGDVDTVYRKYRADLQEIAKVFGEDSLSENMRNTLKDAPYTRVEVLHCVYPRNDYDPTKITAENKRFASVWILLTENHLLRVSGYDSFPYAVWRYDKNTGETYGRCPAIDAIPDLAAMNAMGKSVTGAAEMSLNPPVTAHPDLMGKVKLNPKSITWVEDPNHAPKKVDMVGDVRFALDQQERKQRIIRDHFNVEFFLMLANAERQMTATEILERQTEKAVVLAPAISRLTFEALDKIIERVFMIEMEAGRIDPPPPDLLEAGNGTIDIQYLGPLAQIQKRVFESRGVTALIEGLPAIAQLFPRSLQNIDEDELLRTWAESQNTPQSIIRTEERVAQLRQQLQEAQAKMQKAQATESAARAMKDLGAANQGFDGQLEDAAQQLQGGVSGA